MTTRAIIFDYFQSNACLWVLNIRILASALIGPILGEDMKDKRNGKSKK